MKNSTPKHKKNFKGLSQSATKFSNDFQYMEDVNTFRMYYIDRSPLVISIKQKTYIKIEIKIQKNTVTSAVSYYPDGQVMCKMSMGAADSDKLSKNKPDLSMLMHAEEYHDSG